MSETNESTNRKIIISEIFGPVLQGEGALIGRPTLFVRTGGCDFRCSWCDTLYAVLPEYKADWKPFSEAEILARLDELSGNKPILVTLSGGNPALQPLEKFLQEGKARGYHFAMETQGSVARLWFAHLDYLVLSPKPPSAQMPFDPKKLDRCIRFARAGDTQISLKVVVFDDVDYQFARGLQQQYPDIPFYLQVGNPYGKNDNTDALSNAEFTARLTENLRQLSECVLADDWYNVTVLPQMHVLLHGNKRGV